MKGITIKLSDATLSRLRAEARDSGRSVSEIVRDCIERRGQHAAPSVYELAADVVGSVAGGGRSATNDRTKFRRR